MPWTSISDSRNSVSSVVSMAELAPPAEVFFVTVFIAATTSAGITFLMSENAPYFRTRQFTQPQLLYSPPFILYFVA